MDATTTTTKFTNTTSSEEMRCRYPSKRCEQTRAVKRDGDFHRFCDFHRTKANLNQQRLEQRRKLTNPAPPKRCRSNSRTKSQSRLADVDLAPESYIFKPEPEAVAMPAFHMKDMDLDMDILEELLDLPEFLPFGLDETHAALHMMDSEFANADLLGLSVQW